jgi:carotenoid cleavage dioxygenase-like enzyme
MFVTDQTAAIRFNEDNIAFKGFFAPSRVEADLYDVEVDGTIPQELDGAFYRVGADTQYPPLFEDDIYLNGDGMVTMVRFKDGHADLRTRYVRTKRFELERAARRALLSTTATRTRRWCGTPDGCSPSRRRPGPTSSTR